MAGEKKNPLIGAFRTPPTPGAPPPIPFSPGKSSEEKKPAEPPKTPSDGKTPATGTAIPGKSSEEKKPAEPPKTPGDGKTPAADTATPGKSSEEKKPTEPPKVPGELVKTSLDDEVPKNFKLEIVPADDLGKVVMLPIDLIDDFENHPFPVVDDMEMWDLVESIKQFGVLEAATVIPSEKNPGRYEMVAGHRRKRGSQLAGFTHVPAIVRQMDHDTAVIYMVDSNLKRENLSPMVKARAYAMKLEAMKRKSGRRSKTDILNGVIPKRADQLLADQVGESRSNIQKITRLNKLEPELQEMVEKKVLPVHTAADISYLKKDEQKALADAIEKEGGTIPSGTQAEELKKKSKAGTLTLDKIEKTVAPTKHEVNPPLKVTLTDEELRPYMPPKATLPDAKRIILEALDLRKTLLARQAAKKEAEKKAKEKKAKSEEAPDEETPDQEAPDKEASDKEASDKEAPDKEAPDKEAPDKEAPDNKTPNKKTPNNLSKNNQGKKVQAKTPGYKDNRSDR